MPKVHPLTGLAACGTAGGQISYGSKTGEQFVLCDGGCSFWLNPDEIAYLGPEFGKWNLGGRTLPQRVNIHTGERKLLEDVPPALAREANFLGAGGNRWQAAIAGPVGASFGSCGEHPGGSVSRAMTDGRGAASVDGTIALIDSYQGSNNGFRLGRPDGSITDRIADGSDPYHLTVIDKDRAIWAAPGAWGIYGINPAPLWLKGSLRACWVEVHGVPYLVHWLDGVGLVARPANSKMGTVLSREDKEFHYDAVAWDGGIRVAWALWDGEAPGSLVVVQWDTVSNIIDLAPEVPIVQPTFRFNHTVMVCVIKDPLNASAAPVEVLVNQNAQKGTRPLFVAEDTLNSQWNGPLLGIYTEGKGEQLARVQKLALSLKTRVMVVHDSRDPWTLQPGMRVCDIPVIEFYIYPGETMDQALARWRRDARAVKAAWPGVKGVVPMYYTMGGVPPNAVWPVGTILATQDYLDELVNEMGATLIVPFSYLRGNGITAYPELMTSYNNLLAASGVVELIPVPKPPDPPKPPNPFPPAVPGKVIMTPFKAALRLGAHFFTRVDPTPGLAPWPDWCLVRADRTDQADPDCEWEISMPEGPANTKLRAVHVKTGRTLTFDFTEFGGNVCQGFFGSPDSAGWFGYQQLSGWTLGPNGPEVVTVDYSIVGTKAAAPCLTVVRL